MTSSPDSQRPVGAWLAVRGADDLGMPLGDVHVRRH